MSRTVRSDQASPTRSRSHAAIGRLRMQGIGLIEVLISVLVLGIGLLGIAAMQSLALRGGQSSLESSQAVMQTTAIIEAIRANQANATSYVYNGLASCAALPAAGDLAQNDLRSWVTDLKNTIGAGAASDATTCGRIENLGGNRYRVTVQWSDTRAGGADTRTIVTETRI